MKRELKSQKKIQRKLGSNYEITQYAIVLLHEELVVLNRISVHYCYYLGDM